jgi:glycosyltransferase involved in cell wall biosynthesis
VRVVQALGWYFPESIGGTEVYVAGLSRRLCAAGVDVVIAAPDSAGARERFYEHEGVPVYRYPVPRAPTRAEVQGLVTVRGAERFHDWLRGRRPDVVHVHTFGTGLGLDELKAAKAAGARVFATTHSSSLGWVCQRGTMMRWGEALCDGICRPAKCAACELRRRGLPRALARLVGSIPPAAGLRFRSLPGRLGTALAMTDLIARNQAAQREMLATVDRFVVLTRWALEAVAANGAPPEKLALNRLGVGQTGFSAKPSPDRQPTRLPITVGYLGRLEPVKGVHDLVRAAASLPSEAPIRIEIRGPLVTDDERAYLRELRILAGTDRRIAFLPPVPHGEVPELLAGYDVLCCPAVCLEGGPTVALEAHAAGTPVIGTRIGGLAELVDDGVSGRLVAPGDWQALADVLLRMAGDPAGTIDRWRPALPRPRTMDEVAAEYLTMYGS